MTLTGMLMWAAMQLQWSIPLHSITGAQRRLTEPGLAYRSEGGKKGVREGVVLPPHPDQKTNKRGGGESLHKMNLEC